MSARPVFYDAVRLRAARRWDQLEQDPELAGPWHQLFRQVQSPRHVLSELLQNADDADATEASVRIEDGRFVFEHNGTDFSEDDFASLCRFGYSNKRALHTIGFRGIGFKSTFSLGDCVKLFTPSLAVCFHRRRFSEPHWLPDGAGPSGKTRVVVEISDQHRQGEVRKNLDEWLRSPVSLLFFKNVRQLKISDQELRWGSMGPGPIPGSEWMAPNEDADAPHLLIRSAAEAFPEDALEEIRQERMLGIEEETEFPACNIEIVLGAEGRLYVVLPTGIKTGLPFACNAPFIQDPARLKIKDPETSPTNRWLLDRAGKLAASAMLRWLGQTALPTLERAPAYGLLPDVDRGDTSVEGVCGTAVEKSFGEEIEGQPVLLTEDGNRVPEKRSIAIPSGLLDVWPAEQAAAILDEERRPILSRHITLADCKKLLNWGLVEEFNRKQLLGILQRKHLPKPATWRQLLDLWAYAAPEITGYRHFVNVEDVRIVPVQGKDVLYAASETVRLGEKKLLQSENDWTFLAGHLIVVNQNWPRFLAEQRRTAPDCEDTPVFESVEAAYAVLEEIGLDKTSDVNKIIDAVAAEFYSGEDVRLRDCVRLAQIAAKFRATVGNSFRYVTTDGQFRSIENDILFDKDGSLPDLLPEEIRDSRVLHPDYTVQFSSCSNEDWHHWVSSGRAGLGTFVLIPGHRSFLGPQQGLDEELKKRGFKGDFESHYKNPWFYVDDWDFDEACWNHWQDLADEDPKTWSAIADRILSEKESYWSSRISAQVIEEASNGRHRTIIRQELTPTWALKLGNLPCLPDTHGICCKPGDLLRRTPETEPLIDVEPFVHALLDRETTRPLLDVIGVQSTPTGPDRLLDRLRALARAESPPVHEVEKWYSRLDRMITTCSTDDFLKVRQSFQSEKLILTQNGIWEATLGVFLTPSEEDVPDAETIRRSVNDLTLWGKIGVADRPSSELAIQWLKGLPADESLDPEDGRRVRALLARHPVRIWEECGHWLNLAGEWTATDVLSFSLTMQSLVPWGHLHPWVKKTTADLQRLPVETTANPPFSHLPTLAMCIEEQFLHARQFADNAVTEEWLTAFGAELHRVELDRDEDTRRIRGLANRLIRTKWREAPNLEVIPYINGTPAGTSRRADVLWLNDVLYVAHLPKAKLARRIPEEIGKAFEREDIKAALCYSFKRSARDVREYIEENFTLSPSSAVPEEMIKVIDLQQFEGDGDQGGRRTDGLEHEFGERDDSENQAATILETDNTQDTDPVSVEDKIEPNVDIEVKQPLVQPPRKPAKPDIMERFAKSQGFRKDSETRFFHQNGSWITRTNGACFPWECRTSQGDLVRYYWPMDHCLEREPLQLEADAWGLIEQHPETYALVLSDFAGDPVEVTGFRLLAMRDEGKVILYPATYRLVYGHNRHT